MTTQSERLEFKVGTPVLTTDGALGTLRQVILDPGDGRVSGLVVRRMGIPVRDYVIPVDAVDYTANDGIRLRLTSKEVEAQPVLNRSRYLAPSSSVGDYSSGEALFSLRGGTAGTKEESEGQTGTFARAIRAGQRVEATDGTVGKVDVVLVDKATQRATHFTVRKGLLLHRDIMVPVGWIAEIQDDVIKLGVPKAALEHLPAYVPDQQLQWAVEDALWSDPTLIESVLYESTISVSARDGVVTLRGNVRSSAQRQYIEQVAARVKGVLSINNYLVADDELESTVTEALHDDPRTQGTRINVHSWFGYVHLAGDVPTREVKEAAEQIAAQVPGVRSVVNLLTVSGVSNPLEQERLRELATGQPVYAQDYAQDTLVGKVEKLLVDPRTWRINAIVVRLNSSSSNGKAEQPQKAEQSVVVPVEHIQRVTVGGAYLSLTEEQVRQMPRFEASNYPSPDQSWGSTMPYRPEDIVFYPGHEKAAAR
jgi:osmotically-inducible protein OsmY/sporulation protein YlmC with PRC-barrel domain